MDSFEQLAAAADPKLTHFTQTGIRISADPARVWQALTADINSWWSHSFVSGSRIVMQPRIGGWFCEEFDGEGNGALYGTVTYCQPPQKLIFVGSMGMKHACLCRVTYELEADGDSTLLSNAMEVLGIVEPEVLAGYRNGWGALMGQLKAWVEEGKTVR